MVMEVWGLTGGTLVEWRGSCEAQSAAWPSLLAQARPGEARHVSRPRPALAVPAAQPTQPTMQWDEIPITNVNNH